MSTDIPTTVATTTDAKSSSTTYVILEVAPVGSDDDPQEGYILLGNVTASSGDAAIRQAFKDKLFADEGEYVAVPARSFAPKKIAFEQQTTLKLS